MPHYEDDEEVLKKRRQVSASFMGKEMPVEEDEGSEMHSSGEYSPGDQKKLDEIKKRRRALLASRSKI